MPTDKRKYVQVERGKMRLLYWIQGRCKLCGQFLAKGRKKVCEKCYPKWNSLVKKKWLLKHPHYHRNLRHKKNPNIPYRNRK